MTPSAAGLLVATGFGAGIINGIAGGGSLLSFPVLIAMGDSALVANVTSTVGIWPGYLGGVAGYRSELLGQRDRVRRLAPVAAAGAVAGAVLLLTTPAAAFDAVAPFLILFACALFAAQPLLARRMSSDAGALDGDVSGEGAGASDKQPAAGERLSRPLLVGVFLASVYGSYFGAGLGVVLLAVLGATVVDRLVRLNGLRGVLALLVNCIAVLVFALAAPVEWLQAGVMAGASLVGGYVGSRLARRVPTAVLRGAVITFGVVAAARLLTT